MSTDFLRGFLCGVSAMVSSASSPELHHVYKTSLFSLVKLVAVTLGVMAVTTLALIPLWGPLLLVLFPVVYVLQWIGVTGISFFQVLHLLLLAMMLLALRLASFVAPGFSDGLFFAVLRHADNSMACRLRDLPLHHSTWQENLRYTLGLSLASLATVLVGYVPVVGPPLEIVAGIGVAAHALAWRVLDPLWERVGCTEDQRTAFAQNRLLLYGFMAPVVLLTHVPVVGVLLGVGVAQASAGFLVAQRRPSGDRLLQVQLR